MVKKVVTPAQMAAADRAAIAGGIPSLDLMEAAGSAVAGASAAAAGGIYGKRFVVVCGRGNNAGDGFVAARHLSDHGAHCVVILAGSHSELKGDALTNYRRMRAVRVLPFDESSVNEISRASVVIDALYGTGFRGEMSGTARSLALAMNESRARVVSVDIPSGIDGETGRPGEDGTAVMADLTITMAALKRGLIEYPGSEAAGPIAIADIGIPPELIEGEIGLIESGDIREFLASRRDPTAHKRSVGAVLVIAGSQGMSGAAALTASAAFRAGAGYVTIAAPVSVSSALDQAVTEATVMSLPETGRGTIEASAVDMVLERADSFQAVAIGPGLSTDEETVEFVRKLVSEIERPLVMDADAINAFSGEASVLAGRASPTILTPHPGELARLMGTSTREIGSDRISAACAAAEETGAMVLLKGYRTVVARPPDGSPFSAVVSPTGGPGLATAGSGDVLTGVISAFLAESHDEFKSAWAGAWVHGAAGDLLTERLTERGLMAGDLIEVLPEVLAEVEL